jgi:tetratricopeptide (TPR) repeat protein
MHPGNAKRLIVVLATMAACLLMAKPATAQSDADKKLQAKEHYEKATRFYDVGKYGEAIAEYEQAYLLIDDPALLFNIGQAYRLWDRPEEAIRSYKNYLRRRPQASNRSDVERKIADLDRVVEERRRANVPDAQQPEPRPVEQGPRVDAEPQPQQDDGSGGQPVAGPGIEPGPAAMVPPPQQPVGVDLSQSTPVEPRPHKSRLLPYTLIAVGGVCLLTSLAAAAAGASKAKKLQDASRNHDVYDPTLESSGKAANALAFLAGVGALASGGIGGYLLWRDRQAEQALSAVIVPGFAGARLSLSY